jgi:UDP-2,3-diacylglucosamine pyrophosphatase LpxH
MTDLAITVSDLHLGRGNEQEDFRADQQFLAFCRALNKSVNDMQADTRFILNGDVMDLWEVVPDDELTDDAGTRIADHLFYPAGTPFEQGQAVDRGKWQIGEILRSHPDVVEGLKALADNPRIRFYYTYGNHDGAMRAPDLQDAFRTALIDSGVDLAQNGRLAFGHCFSFPELRAYFEHGHQLHRDESSFEDATDPWAQAEGFYFLRFIWNRLQAQFGSRDNTTTKIRLALLLLFNPKQELPRDTIHFLYEYFEAFRLGLIPRIVNGPLGLVQTLYRDWMKKGSPLESTAEVDDSLQKQVESARVPATENETDPPPATFGVTDLGADRPELPGKPTHQEPELGPIDVYWKGIESRFRKNAEKPFPKLGKDMITTFLGHTHSERYAFLHNAPIKGGVNYVNTGSWTHGTERLMYGWASSDGDPFKNRGLRVWQ